MEDIAALDRRIQSLEYYQELTMLESQVTNLSIPSGTDPTLNRFKFGFFADNFSTAQYSDTLNPEYHASLENDQVTPPVLITNMEFDFNLADGTTAGAVTGSLLALPWTDSNLISQLYATVVPPPAVTAPTPPPPAPPVPPQVNYIGTMTCDQLGISVTTPIPTAAITTPAHGGGGGNEVQNKWVWDDL
jgi:hypothetical protein